MAKRPSKSGDRAPEAATDRAVVPAGDEPGLGLDLPPASAQKPYVVLARKYRPQTFDDLIGQDAMVRTLRNAFAADRIAQAYMLTGVRGVGKTTTARILARALNYLVPGRTEKPSIDMPELGVHCAEIMESRHPDVLEMDAASNTSVDNIRELIEGARYKPISARTKVYIIDEVHMLSKSAFNALLKTLEEPPGHVKFIFATTEVRKVPVTVLSRCQRFDLRRVDVPELAAHFGRIVAREGAAAEPDALALIARAAEGSVRDGLSILDQAIATGAGSAGKAASVTVDVVRTMLGLADRGRIFDLLEQLLAGDARAALAGFDALNRDGADPAEALADLAEAVHITTRAKALGADAAGEGLSAEEVRRAGALADRLSIAFLARAWQMLLKGLEEAQRAPNARAAAEMVLVRMAFTSDLPTPDDVIRVLGGAVAQRRNGAGAERQQSAASEPAAHAGAGTAPPSAAREQPPAPPPAPVEELAEDEGSGLDDPAEAAPYPSPAMARLLSFADVVDFVGSRRDIRLKTHLEEHVSLVRFDPEGRIELNLLAGAPPELGNELREKLNKWTGGRWMVALSRAAGERPIGVVRREAEAAEIAAAARHPAVRAVLEQFPDARIEAVRKPGARLDEPEDDAAAG